MYCAKCGKEIDNDSTFCPCCGQKVGAPVENTNFGRIAGSLGKKGIQKASVLLKFAGNKKAYGFLAAFVAVAIVISGVVKFSGGKKSAPEKLYQMSWKETSKFSMDDFADFLDSRDIRYAKESWSRRYNIGNGKDLFMTLHNDTVYAKEFEPFFGGDCIFYYTTYSSKSYYTICYKTLEEFEKGKEAIENDIRKKCPACGKKDFEDHNHLIELTKENVDICIENAIEHELQSVGLGYRTVEEYEENARNEYSDSDISVCRVVQIGGFGEIDDYFMQSYMIIYDEENYNQEMFEPYSYYYRFEIYHELEEESVVKEILEKL